MLLQKVLPLRELKLSTTKEEWEELIRESISQVTEVTSFSMLNAWTQPVGAVFAGAVVSWIWSLRLCSAQLISFRLCLLTPGLSRVHWADSILVILLFRCIFVVWKKCSWYAQHSLCAEPSEGRSLRLLQVLKCKAL